MTKQSNKHIGSSLDDFLKEQGIYEEAKNRSVKKVIAWQISEAMKEQKISKTKMAEKMKTSRSQLDRLLDPEGENITLETLTKAAAIVGRKIKLELI